MTYDLETRILAMAIADTHAAYKMVVRAMNAAGEYEGRYYDRLKEATKIVDSVLWDLNRDMDLYEEGRL